MRDTVPAPDPDDAAACGCGKATRGVGARRFFRRHDATCRCWTELRYGELVRAIGPIERPSWARPHPAETFGRIFQPTQERP